MTGRADYYERQEARKERLEDRAERKMAEATALFHKGDLREEVSGIPFGQPILVGHHSEKRHRRAIEKADNAMRRGCEAYDEAQELARRAAAAEANTAISSDNPDAVELLREKLAKLEEKQAHMVAANKLVRKQDAPALATLLGCSVETVTQFMSGSKWERGYQGYQLSNNSANMKRIRDRIAHLERNANREEKETLHNSGVRMVENPDVNRVQLFFPGKPDSETRTKLKQAGFRWSPMEGAWQRQLNNRAVWVAGEILKELNTEAAACQD